MAKRKFWKSGEEQGQIHVGDLRPLNKSSFVPSFLGFRRLSPGQLPSATPPIPGPLHPPPN